MRLNCQTIVDVDRRAAPSTAIARAHRDANARRPRSPVEDAALCRTDASHISPRVSVPHRAWTAARERRRRPRAIGRCAGPHPPQALSLRADFLLFSGREEELVRNPTPTARACRGRRRSLISARIARRAAARYRPSGAGVDECDDRRLLNSASRGRSVLGDHRVGYASAHPPSRGRSMCSAAIAGR